MTEAFTAPRCSSSLRCGCNHLGLVCRKAEREPVMSAEYPKDGSSFTTRFEVTETYRWKKYKPDGARQMGKPGRWQRMVWKGEYYTWENCEEPEGSIKKAEGGRS